ncbi:MAG: ATP-binding protein [Chloroflexi bacterium]|nr:ATP-binding protein [Chloroflexota bacterium]
MPTIIVLTLALINSIIILVVAIKNWTKNGASSLILFASAVTVAAIANFYLDRGHFLSRSFWLAVIQLSVSLGYITILTFVIHYTRSENRLLPATLAILALEPLVTQILFWNNPGGFFFSPKFYLNPPDPIAANSPWFSVNAIYSTGLLLIALVMLARDFSYRPLAYRHQTIFIMSGIAASIVINNNFSIADFVLTQDLKVLSLLATGIALTLGFRNAGIFEIPPITRESVVQSMNDGWIVMDANNRIVDINTAAEKLIGVPGKKLWGLPAEEIFINWPNLMNSLNDNREIGLKGSVKIDEEWIFLDIHTSPLIDANSNQFGKLIVWRDITERRLADEARQQARDEMFILLHSITSAASRAINLDDFLAESIYQIVYSSHSQSITVYLLDEHYKTEKGRNLVLAAQHGLPLVPNSHMVSIPANLEIVEWVLNHGTPLLIPDMQSDARIPAPMRDLGPMSLLLIPMIMEGQTLGMISLSRTGNSPYTPDEVARLTAVTDEVATFVLSNRQRQLSIALAERQRLVRDLHDSVTQKLYGLVTLAEATQAGIQAGVTDMPAKVIVRMAENARQALKEMRLFMFQMQPVDFERDGLVEAIQYRLSAVEGRADINARLSTDDDISLPLEKELALYFITQEALNNVIKHAKATQVNVSMKNKKTNFILEVDDNGCGFDPKITDHGGIGMRSMRERALQIGGKLKISSAPGKGTKITVTLKNNGHSGGDE